jgi:hypothetical protein
MNVTDQRQQLVNDLAAAIRQRAILLAQYVSVGPDQRATVEFREARYSVISLAKRFETSGAIDAANLFIDLAGAKQAEAALAKWTEDNDVW